MSEMLLTGNTASDFYWYHCLNLPTGERTDGDFDMTPVMPHYHFPVWMDGLRVLDIGRGSGAFAFEFEHRGAAVTATELPSFLDWDFVGGEEQREKMKGKIGNPEDFSRHHIYGAFDYAKQALRSNVESKFINVYNLCPEAFRGGHGMFDITFAGSITSHLRDPILAFQRIRSVTKSTFIVSAPSFEIPGQESIPLMCLVTGDPDRRSWWVMNGAALVETLKAGGFARTEIKSRFSLKHRKNGMSYDHIVAHAFV